MDAPLSEAPALSPQPIPWYEVWETVLLHPSRASFFEILADPTAGSARAYAWIAITAAISAVIQSLITPELSEYSPWVLVCSVVAAPVAAVLGMVIGAGITHFIAGLLGGSGTFDRLVYCLAAIYAPSALISLFFTGMVAIAGVTPGSADTLALAAGPALVVLFVVALLSLAFGIYAIVLQVNAIAAAENISGGRALVVFLLPSLAGFGLGIACILLGALPALMAQGN